MQEIPKKSYYKISEVCRHADTQPYVLRFWESEFPQLTPRKSRGGQSVYSRKDLEMVLRIKSLLHEEEFSIADARKVLEEGRARSAAPAKATPKKPAPAKVSSAARKKEESAKLAELRRRYDAACGEIVTLKGRLSEANDSEGRLVKAHEEIQGLRKKLAEAEKARDRLAERANRVADTLEKVADSFGKLTGARRHK